MMDPFPKDTEDLAQLEKNKDMVEGHIESTTNGGTQLPAQPPSNFARNFTLPDTE